MKAKNNTLESMDNWFIGSELYLPKQSECDQCELLRMEVKRLKWLIQNMMTDIGEIKEFRE